VSLPWRYFSSGGPEPSWIGELRTVLVDISDALPAVHRSGAVWGRDEPLPRDWDGERPVLGRPLVLPTEPLTAARTRLEQIGFVVRGPLLPDGALQALAEPQRREVEAVLARHPKPLLLRAPGQTRPLPAVPVDAWHPASRIAVHVDWPPGGWTNPARHAAELLKLDVDHLVLARDWRATGRNDGFAETDRVLCALFDDPATAAAIRRRLPLRGVLLGGI
jgi:hypothetical protein